MDLVVKVLVSLMIRLVSEKFFSKIIICSLGSWSKQTENQWDNHVVKAMAEALDVDLEVLVKPAA